MGITTLFRQTVGQNSKKLGYVWQRLFFEIQQQINQTLSKSLMVAIAALSSKLESQNFLWRNFNSQRTSASNATALTQTKWKV